MSVTRKILIAQIDAGNRLRVLDPAWVKTLAEDMAVEGQEEPIRVVERGDRFQLVAGARRLAAAALLDWIEIDATVKPAGALADETSARLAEIKADMMRGELTAMDHAVYVATWCDLHRQAQAPRKRGPKPALPDTDAGLDELSANLALNWTEAAQAALGIGRRSIFRSLKIAAIAPELRARIALLPVATKQTELLALAEQSNARQATIVELLTSEPARATGIAEALMLLGAVPASAPEPAYARISERFSRLPQKEQHAFFSMHESAIDLWIAQRGARSLKAVG